MEEGEYQAMASHLTKLLINIPPLKERKAAAELPPERADVIIAGGTILLHFLLRFGSNRTWASRHELRYKILFDRFFTWDLAVLVRLPTQQIGVENKGNLCNNLLI